MADDLVERVVTSDVLAQRDQLPGDREQARGMEAPGGVEHLLVGPEPIGEGDQHRSGDPGVGPDRGHVAQRLVEGRLAAQTAAGAHRERPSRHDDRVADRDGDDVVLLLALPGEAVRHRRHRPPLDQLLAGQEPDGEVEVVPRGPHRHRDRPGLLAGPVHPDLEGLLGHQPVVPLGARRAVHGAQPHRRHRATGGGDHPARLPKGSGRPLQPGAGDRVGGVDVLEP